MDKMNAAIWFPHQIVFRRDGREGGRRGATPRDAIPRGARRRRGDGPDRRRRGGRPLRRTPVPSLVSPSSSRRTPRRGGVRRCRG